MSSNFERIPDDENPGGSFLRLQTIERIEVQPVPHHDGIALLLESIQLGSTQWALTKEQSLFLFEGLKRCLESLSSNDS